MKHIYDAVEADKMNECKQIVNHDDSDDKNARESALIKKLESLLSTFEATRTGFQRVIASSSTDTARVSILQAIVESFPALKIKMDRAALLVATSVLTHCTFKAKSGEPVDNTTRERLKQSLVFCQRSWAFTKICC